MANIEIIPEEYMPIVDMLRDIYAKEIPVVHEVAVGLKTFIDEIEDRYQNVHAWFSDTEYLHYNQKADYLLNDPQHLTDVKRHQSIVRHLRQHLSSVESYVSVAYSKIHSQITYEEPLSALIEQFNFPTEEEYWHL